MGGNTSTEAAAKEKPEDAVAATEQPEGAEVAKAKKKHKHSKSKSAAKATNAGEASSSSAKASKPGLLSFGGKVAYKNQKDKKPSAAHTEYDFFFKILLVGDSSVGKSCFLLRFCDESFFSESFISTIGVDFKIRTVQMNGKVVKLQLWDTAGQERFRTITSSYYRGAQGIILCYDVSDRTTFNNIRAWLGEIERYASENVSVVICGMKRDLRESGQACVSHKEARNFGREIERPVCECSSKNNVGVNEAVLGLCEQIARRMGIELSADDAVMDVQREEALSSGDESAESISDSDLEADVAAVTINKSKKEKAVGAQKKKRKAKKADVNVCRLGLNSLADSDVTLMTGDPLICKRCGVMFSELSHTRKLTHGEAHRITEETVLGPSFTPAPPIHKRFEAGSWVAGPLKEKEKESEDEEGNYWCCEFCGAANLVDPETGEGEVPTAPSVDYLVQPAPAASSELGANIVFVIDISGSMCVTTEVAGNIDLKNAGARAKKLQETSAEFGSQYLPREKRGVTHVSRLQCLQMAIEEQIKRLTRESPNKRVGLIAFSDEVTLIGDGLQEQVTVAGDRLNSWEELGAIGAKFKLTRPVKETSEALIKALYSLEESGATALGPALILAIALSGNAPGSNVILCTDGLANQGLGSLEGKEKDFVAFYTECGEQAVLRGVTVSVLSLIGTDCRLESLSVVTEKTSGTVERVDPTVLTRQLNAIVGAPPVIAYGSMAMILLHRGLRFRGEMDDETEQRFWVVKDLGNVTTVSECTFSYAFRTKEEFDMSNLAEIPFQVQILFTRPDGAIHLRVSTATVKVTENREEAEAAADAHMIGTHAARAAAKFAKQGNYEQAQLATRAAARLMTRVGAGEEEVTTFASKVEEMDAVLRTERKQEGEKEEGAAAVPANVTNALRKAKRNDAAAAAISKML
eukprot:TRINITY_DN2149_c0_g1_i3.p1 TRINITY_DN2149_c0_g1~~TRINITY_DN2149_c0_g1_i3.p1  ORF type:complete len:939 (-),score=238.17 TRINITY_DN2149_c0_g1_i3:129-2897(-)